MKIIPKYSNGGSNSLFTIYNPARVPSVSDYQRYSNRDSEFTTIKSSTSSVFFLNFSIVFVSYFLRDVSFLMVSKNLATTLL